MYKFNSFLTTLLVLTGFILFSVNLNAQFSSTTAKPSQSDNNNRDGVLQYDDGTVASNIGLTGGGTFEVAARFTPDLTGPLAGDNVESLEIHIGDLPTSVILKIYDEGTATEPGALLHEQDVTSIITTADTWYTLVLDTPVPVSGNDLWCGYEVTHGADMFPAAGDGGPANANGDWIMTGGSWAKLGDLVPTIDLNWNIHAYTVTPGGGDMFTDDFDSYVAGEQLACQNPDDWTTWSDDPCNATEDAFISDNFSYSNPNSAVIVQNNDLVYLTGEKTSGTWWMSMMVYVPSGKTGYFNAMSGFTPNPFQWGMECYLNAGGAGELSNGSTVDFNWIEGAWQQAVLKVDLDNDEATFYFGYPPVEIATWQWTRGGSVNLQLDAFDFFGATANDELYFDDFYFGDEEPGFVPVELTSFTADVNDGNVTLNWTTASEINNQMFEVERKSVDGEFARVGFVEGYGTTTEEQTYSYVDGDVTPGTYTYRLKQIDFGGSFEYSDAIEVEVEAPLAFALDQNYPNPFNPTTTINYSLAAAGKVNVSVYNLLGQKVKTLVDGFQEAGHYDVNFDASNISSGVYFYKIVTDNFVQAKKMILSK